MDSAQRIRARELADADAQRAERGLRVATLGREDWLAQHLRDALAHIAALETQLAEAQRIANECRSLTTQATSITINETGARVMAEASIATASARADTALAIASQLVQTSVPSSDPQFSARCLCVVRGPAETRHGDRATFTVHVPVQAIRGWKGPLYAAIIHPAASKPNPELLERMSIMLAEQYQAEKAKEKQP